MKTQVWKYKGVRVETGKGKGPFTLKMTFPDGKVVKQVAMACHLSHQEALGEAKYLINQKLRDFGYPAATMD